MSRYIDADAAKQDAEERGGTLWLTDGDVKEVKRFLDDQPTADVAPVVHAYWIRHEWAEEVEGILISNYECSHCHEWFRDNRGHCGECGARMDGRRTKK